jgi:hypothetical protein
MTVNRQRIALQSSIGQANGRISMVLECESRLVPRAGGGGLIDVCRVRAVGKIDSLGERTVRCDGRRVVGGCGGERLRGRMVECMTFEGSGSGRTPAAELQHRAQVSAISPILGVSRSEECLDASRASPPWRPRRNQGVVEEV